MENWFLSIQIFLPAAADIVASPAWPRNPAQNWRTANLKLADFMRVFAISRLFEC